MYFQLQDVVLVPSPPEIRLVAERRTLSRNERSTLVPLPMDYASICHCLRWWVGVFFVSGEVCLRFRGLEMGIGEGIEMGGEELNLVSFEIRSHFGVCRRRELVACLALRWLFWRTRYHLVLRWSRRVWCCEGENR